MKNPRETLSLWVAVVVVATVVVAAVVVAVKKQLKRRSLILLVRRLKKRPNGYVLLEKVKQRQKVDMVKTYLDKTKDILLDMADY